MICPNCHETYTADQPCSCRARLTPPVQPGPLHVSTGSADEELSSALAPTGLDNPFWKA